MQTSVNSAKILFIINVILLVPFTMLTVIGFYLIVPLIAWGFGVFLLVFYFNHGFRNLLDIGKIRIRWISSLVFNGIGAICVFFVGGEIFDEIGTVPLDASYFLGDEWLFVLSTILWIASTFLNLGLSSASLVSFKKLQTPLLT